MKQMKPDGILGEPISRRWFLRTLGAGGIAAAMPWGSLAEVAAGETAKEASFYARLDDGSVQCQLCPWHCVVPKGGRGRCRVRENREGRYYSLVYGRPCATHLDPIEKKPFFHVYPGSTSFSIATVGCNIHCRFCQNWDISQAGPEEVRVVYRSARAIAEEAVRVGARTIAYTYSEPVVFCEYVLDCAREARARGIGNVIVSNGFIEANPLEELCRAVTAIKIDLKAFTERFYEDICSGQLAPVLETIKRIKGAGVWLEIVVLLIPTLNDRQDEIKRMAAWVVREVGQDVPLHFTRFHPNYKLRNFPPTPAQTLRMARETALAEGCRFVYTGNIPGEQGENTYCPKCKATVIARYGFLAKPEGLKDGKCAKCGQPIPGVWG